MDRGGGRGGGEAEAPLRTRGKRGEGAVQAPDTLRKSSWVVGDGFSRRSSRRGFWDRPSEGRRGGLSWPPRGEGAAFRAGSQVHVL